MSIDAITLAVSKGYTDESVAGGGAIKGKNCTITDITPITGGNRVTFEWTLDNGTTQTDTMDVMDGEKGEQGDDYSLTSQDKADIADIVLNELVSAETQEV